MGDELNSDKIKALCQPASIGDVFTWAIPGIFCSFRSFQTNNTIFCKN